MGSAPIRPVTVLKRRKLLVWTIRPHHDSHLIGCLIASAVCASIWRLDLRRDLFDQSESHHVPPKSNQNIANIIYVVILKSHTIRYCRSTWKIHPS